MNRVFSFRLASRVALGFVLGTAVFWCQAQTTNRSVRSVPQRQAPVLAAGQLGPGAPNPAGLPSPIPNPAGLTSPFPAGLPAPASNPQSVPVPTETTLPPTNVGVGGGGRPVDSTTAPQTAVMGFGAPAGPLSPGTGGGLYTALQVARSFIIADANRDGELTHAEARRLTLTPYTFEEMDANHDGIVTRFEYEDAMH